ncbi:MAG: T9SS type A sorting domain-containing protein [Chitinophagales bacterium]|nr:T9SS type A sorting domain-containing protein [Chitinophagales bacterium]
MNKNILISGLWLVVFCLDFSNKKNETEIFFHEDLFPEESARFKEEKTEALEALAFLNAINAYPNVDIPQGAYAQAFEKYHTQYKDVASVRGGEENSWENVGPNNIGGRTVSIAIDPVDTNIVWLGSASGGLWKSTTGGIGVDAWQNIPTGFEVLGVGGIAINPDNTNEMFIGTGETYAYGTTTNGLVTRTERGTYGIGILKTTDGGVTWEKSLDWTYQENRGVWEILYNPVNTDIVYAATTEGVYKTADDGETWSLILDKKMVMDIEMDKSNGEIIYAGVGNLESDEKGIYKSEDSGVTWELLTTGLPPYTHDGRITLAAYPGNYNILIAIIGNAFNTVGIYRTENAGDSWTEVDDAEIVSYQGWFSKGLVFKADDDDRLIAGGVEVHRSLNGGNSWTQLTTYTGPSSIVHPDIHDIISNPLDPDKIYIINDGGLYRSNDFCNTFYSCNDGYVTSQHYIGSISQQTNDVGLAGLQDNFTLRYDGTKYWLALIGGDGSYNAINPEDDFIQYGSYQYGNILRSTDQGYNFYEYIYGSPYPYVAFIAPYLISPSHVDVLYAGDNNLDKSENGGTSWFTPESDDIDDGNPILSIGVSSSHPDTVYCATAPLFNDASVFKSTDGGETFADITQDLPDRYPRDIAVNRTNANELYVCYSGFGTGHIFRSYDGGENWTDLSTTLPDIPFHTVLIDPFDDSTIYAGCDITVFVSADKGTSWEIYNTGLPEAVMIFDLIASVSDSSIFAFTHGRGVFTAPVFIDTIPDDTIPENILGGFIEDFEIFPNPATDEFHISTDKLFEGGKVEINIYDLAGEIVLQKQINALPTHYLLHISALPAGTYYIEIKNDSYKKSKKVVII